MSFTDALSRISEIQQQMTSLADGSALAAASATSANSSTPSTSSDSAGATSPFADALAEAQLSGSGNDGSSTSSDSTAASLLSGLLSAAGDGTGSSATVTASGGASIGGAALPANAASQLTSDQRQFASTLSADTGLNPGVICAWMVSEENGSAAQARQAAHNNDWLNIGYTDTATIGADDAIWSDPVSAASATAAWLKGQNSIPGYGTASSGVQSILDSVGQSPQAQISALQNSGWASGGYPDLSQVYSNLMGG